ncbi:unnamed protein product [Ceratitis capitata]|uniref:(Mediterranean fruit fly) hypothetical protein n=1 Tax=Ceratitis capitata TaxID=7213 RepID=A0A811V850_CERCA|nr:unnamed protein product [Ceratitis capitata]
MPRTRYNATRGDGQIRTVQDRTASCNSLNGVNASKEEEIYFFIDAKSVSRVLNWAQNVIK